MTEERKPDFDDLCWLVGRYRRGEDEATTNRAYWLDTIRTDFGDDIARIVETVVLVEDTPRLLIEAARKSLHQAYASTYMLLAEAYDKHKGES